VVFAVVGEDRVCYGGDAEVTGGKSFKEWVLSRGEYDLCRFVFTGLLPPAELARLLAVSDLHVYLTVPFVLSWSLFDALACGAVVLASDTAPVREVVADGATGLLADFFDADGLADRVGQVLDDPGAFRHLGRAGCELVRERYSLDACVPRMLDLYDEAAYARRQGQARFGVRQG
jgi:glycosyltransferase involved in cell wall biosynthesis